ncbi:MAG: alanine--tRNA ligase [Candidatus Omnitrophota bacterium]
MITTDSLRKRYLDFFRSKDHRVFGSDSLVPADDPSLLFTGAGMNQFKPYFLGLKKDVRRAASCQKCLRTADLDRVGKTAYHHSFFEMLGNFSFGDYFKEEAIAWGWEFVTKELGLPKDRLWVSVFEEDSEAFDIWKKKIGLPDARIVRMGAEDNFWPSNARLDGPNGPCGPCSEIYVGETPGKGVEIWNLVFTQYDRQSDATLIDLPQKNIDTGMGLERTAAVLQGVETNFDADNFKKIRLGLRSLIASGSELAHENAAMDHARAAVFSIADGALPSNEGRGYVVRKLIRLGSDHFEKAGTPKVRRTFFKLVPFVVDVYGAVYPELADRQKTISSILENEEKAYEESCRRAEGARQGAMSADEFAFMLYDTFGLPVDKIKDKFSKERLLFNEEKFIEVLNQQRERSRASSKIAGEIFSKKGAYGLADDIARTEFTGYHATEGDGTLLRVIKNNEKVKSLKAGEEGVLIFNRTPFYAEAGGQVGDTGEITAKDFQAAVLDTQVLEKAIAHKVRVGKGEAREVETYHLKVDGARRADIMKNHTATHLLHSALRKVLGEHVKQSGSLVAPDRLRFDFTHFKAVEPDTLRKVEDLVNAEIKKNTPLEKKVLPKDAALKEGAIAFFGEKYEDEVRVVSIGEFSKELCGGTHLHSTGEIEHFKIISEGSIQAGVRRIEAVTGRKALQAVEESLKEVESLARAFGSSPEGLPLELKRRAEKVEGLKNRLMGLAGGKMKAAAAEAFDRSMEDRGVKIVILKTRGADVALLETAAKHLRSLNKSFAAVLASESEGKVSFAVAGSDDLVKKGFHSGRIVKDVAAVVLGNGGGRPDFAVGGGKGVEKENEAIELGKREIGEWLKSAR